MKIPKKIYIAGREIEIEWNDAELLKRARSGEADYDGSKITLSHGQSLNRTRENTEITFIHEILHWIDHVTSLNLKEEEIERFSEILYQVLKQINE